MLSDWRCSETEVWVRIPAREYSKMCLLSNLILEQGVNRIHLGLAFLFRMTGDQITKVKLTTHPVIRHIRKNAMNDEKIGFVYDKVNISITVYQVRMTHAKRLK
jgi:hypothetical protein